MPGTDVVSHPGPPTTGGSWRLDNHFVNAMGDPWYRRLVDLQDALTRGTFTFFGSRGLRAAQLPITTSSVSSPMGLGSDSSPVSVELFGVKTYLADSMQFLLEYACRLADCGSFYLMPSFRGENADESHVSQFYHAEAEIAGGMADVITLVEDYLRYLTAEIATSCSHVLDTLDDTSHIEALINGNRPFEQVTFAEARSLLHDDPVLIRQDAAGFRTLTRPGERELMARFGGFVWLTEQDQLAVPFYQSTVPGQSSQALAADLLFGIGEVVGAGERHTRSADVSDALARHQVDPGPYDWYLQMKRLRPLRTAGFGMGTERYLAWLLRHHDIRDCQLLPRFNGEPCLP